MTLQEKEWQVRKGQCCTETRVNQTKAKCSHWGKTGHIKSSCWKKYLHKVPSKSSIEASGVFLNKELLVCNINVNDTYCITENIESA
jgi:hypothetical protein